MVVLRELDIIQVTNCAYTISTIIDWYDLMNKNPDRLIPEWALFCRIYAPYHTSEDLGKAILKVVKTSPNNANPEVSVQRVLDELGVRLPAAFEKVFHAEQKVATHAQGIKGRKHS